MKKLALTTIGILFSLSLMSQIFEVKKEIQIENGDTTEFLSDDYELSVTKVDTKFNGKGKAKVILYLPIDHKENHTSEHYGCLEPKMVLKCSVVESYYKEGMSGDKATFVLQEDEFYGKIEYDIDKYGSVRAIHLDYDKEKKHFKKILIIQ